MPDDDILDLSPPEPRKPVRFRVGPADDDLFTAAPALPTMVAFDFARLSSDSQGDGLGNIEAILGLFERILVPESRQRFQARLADTERPIDPGDLTRIIKGLLGKYGMRPTEPSGPSSNGPPGSLDGGMSSPGTPSAEASTSSGSLSNGSAISPTPSSSPA